MALRGPAGAGDRSRRAGVDGAQVLLAQRCRVAAHAAGALGLGGDGSSLLRCQAVRAQLRIGQGLAGALYTSKSGLTYQITQLEKAGLVRRASALTDVRGVVAVLTDAGRERLAQAAPGHVAAVRALLIDVLTEQQLAAVADGLGEVARRLGEG